MFVYVISVIFVMGLAGLFIKDYGLKESLLGISILFAGLMIAGAITLTLEVSYLASYVATMVLALILAGLIIRVYGFKKSLTPLLIIFGGIMIGSGITFSFNTILA